MIESQERAVLRRLVEAYDELQSALIEAAKLDRVRELGLVVNTRMTEGRDLLVAPPAPSPLEVAARAVVEARRAVMRDATIEIASNDIETRDLLGNFNGWISNGPPTMRIAAPEPAMRVYEAALDALERALGEGEPSADRYDRLRAVTATAVNTDLRERTVAMGMPGAMAPTVSWDGEPLAVVPHVCPLCGGDGPFVLARMSPPLRVRCRSCDGVFPVGPQNAEGERRSTRPRS